jgi:hypothetical protein
MVSVVHASYRSSFASRFFFHCQSHDPRQSREFCTGITEFLGTLGDMEVKNHFVLHIIAVQNKLIFG